MHTSTDQLDPEVCLLKVQRLQQMSRALLRIQQHHNIIVIILSDRDFVFHSLTRL